MFQIDRSSTTSVHEQLLHQLRYQLMMGKYRVHELLPSTRILGDQLGISFHTVRKVYQQLEAEGFLDSQQGRGFVVLERMLPDKATRMEKGAALMQETLQQLFALGLNTEEVQLLIDEQLDAITTETPHRILYLTANFAEAATSCAQQLSQLLHETITPVPISEIHRQKQAEYVICPLSLYRLVKEKLPNALVLGIQVLFAPEILQQVAQLLPSQMLAIITFQSDAIPHIIQSLKQETGFGGEIVALDLDNLSAHQKLIQQAAFVIYTPQCRRRLQSALQHQKSAMLTPFVSRASCDWLLTQLQ